MNVLDELGRSLIRGAAYRVTRTLPWWASLLILGAALLFGLAGR